MDPNQWAAYNPAYRLNAAAGGIPTNPRFEIPLIEQAAPPGQGLGVLPAHTSLTQPRGLGGLPTVNYGHPALGTVSQFLDTMSTLGSSIAGSSSPYKTVTVGQPAYTLESPPRTSATNVAITTIAPPKTWELSSFMPSSTAGTNPFSGLPQDLATTTAFNTTPLVEPPPAHSRNPPGSRASTIQRNPYQKEYGESPLQPVTAHSGGTRTNNQGVYSSLSVEREPPIAHSHGQFSSYGPSNPLLTSGNSHQRNHQHVSSHQQSLSSGMRGSTLPSQPVFSTSQQMQQQQVQETYSYSRVISNNTFVTSNKMTPHIDTSPSLSYEAVSPAPAPAITDSAGRDTFTTMSLQDLADISSNQEKLPLQRQQAQNTVTTWASSHHHVHQLPKDSQSSMSSPHSHLGSPHMVSMGSDQSPMHQPSPNNHTNVGSPQVGMSLGSPQSASSTVAPPPMPVQAIPDSTTKPRKRSRKKKEDKVSSVELSQPYESPVSIPQPPFHTTPDLSQFNVSNETPSGFPAQVTSHHQQQEFSTLTFNPPAGTVGNASNPTDSVFMTNAFGNSFVNPNDAMGTGSMPHDEKPDCEMEYREMTRKAAAAPPTQPAEVDEEFAHLVAPPEITPSKAITSDTPEKAEKQPPGSTSSAFQNSFLSFLQGNKPETLSSVTNSNVQRPPMPKYIPDTRPVVPLVSKVKEEPKRSDRRRQSDMDVPSVTFSDEEENSSQGTVNKTVAKVLGNLSGEEDSAGRGSTPATRRGRGRGIIIKGRPKPVGRRRKPSWEDDKDEDEDFNPGESESDDAVEEPQPPPPKKKAPSPIPVRERPSRRAKEKVEEKRKAKQEKKKRKMYVRDTDSESSELQVSSEDDVEPVEKDYDSDKDPVWRPNPVPEFVPVVMDEDEEGAARKAKQRGKRFRSLSSKSSRSRTRAPKPIIPIVTPTLPSTPAAAPTVATTTPVKVDEPTLVPEPVHLPSDDEEPVHRFMKGDYVLERKDMTNYDSFPIWKIDAGRLIQKFEPFTKDDRMIHKAMSTYSSWSDAIRHQFKAIRVRIVQTGRGQGQEQVEVLEPFRPVPPDTNEEEEDELMPSFNIYMQILISQALEPGFLAAINEEKDEYYHGPLRRVDELIDESKTELDTVLDWRDIFKEHVRLYPECKIFERPNTTAICQAARGAALTASRVVLLSGEAYDGQTLEPIPAKTMPRKEYYCNPVSIKHLETYHNLHHFRHRTYQNCISKVVALKEANKDLENRDILDQSLQNRLWVQKMFRDLKSLVKKASEKT